MTFTELGLNTSLGNILFLEIKIYGLKLKCKGVRREELHKENDSIFSKNYIKYAIKPFGFLRQRIGKHTLGTFKSGLRDALTLLGEWGRAWHRKEAQDRHHQRREISL